MHSLAQIAPVIRRWWKQLLQRVIFVLQNSLKRSAVGFFELFCDACRVFSTVTEPPAPLDEGVLIPRLVALQNQAQAGLHYVSFTITVAWNTLWRADAGILCVSVHRVTWNMDAKIDVTWSSTTQSIASLLTRSMSMIGGGSGERMGAPRIPEAVIRSSIDFDWISQR